MGSGSEQSGSSAQNTPNPGVGGPGLTSSTVLGEFEIRREIGRGGMGTVYEAWQPSLGRSVALKVLDRQVSASQVAVARFQREAQAAARLNHPHIVPIYAQGSVDGTYYYAMELVNGDSLAGLIHKARAFQTADTASVDVDATVVLPRGKTNTDSSVSSTGSTGTGARGIDDDSNITLSVPIVRHSWEDFRTIARRIAEIADALAYAHEQGVIHRDIKPHNILLGADGRLRISDFGLARLAEQPGVTMTGELLGSPLYMSPEQITGAPGAVDHRTDIYSLGATLYEWLALTPPFPGETRERVISRIMTDEAPPLRRHNPNIPAELETICAKALERDASRRYATAADLREDLLRFLDRRPLKARRPGVVARAAKIIRRHQVTTVASVGLVIGSILLLALYSTRSRVARESQAAAQAQGQTEEILDAIGPEILALMRSAQAVQGLVGAGAKPATGQIDNNQPTTRSEPSVGSPLSIAQRATREYYNAITSPDWITNLVLLSSSDDGQPDPLLYNLEEAQRLWHEGELARARGLLDAYIAARPNDMAVRQMHAALCAELKEFERVAEDADVMIRLDSQSVHTYLWRGIAHLLLENLENAHFNLSWATDLDRRSVWAKVMLGLAKIGQGRAPGALIDFEDALRENPDLAIALLGRASAYFADGKFSQAIADADAVLQNEPDNADALTIRGDCRMSLGQYAEAAVDYQAAIDVVGRTTELGFRYLSAVVQQRQLVKGKSADDAKDTLESQESDQTRLRSGGDSSNEGASAQPVLDWLSRIVNP